MQGLAGGPGAATGCNGMEYSAEKKTRMTWAAGLHVCEHQEEELSDGAAVGHRLPLGTRTCERSTEVSDKSFCVKKVHPAPCHELHFMKHRLP